MREEILNNEYEDFSLGWITTFTSCRVHFSLHLSNASYCLLIATDYCWEELNNFLESKIGTKTTIFRFRCTSGQIIILCLQMWTTVLLYFLCFFMFIMSATAHIDTNRYDLDKVHISRMNIWRDTNAFGIESDWVVWAISFWLNNNNKKKNTWSTRMRDKDFDHTPTISSIVLEYSNKIIFIYWMQFDLIQIGFQPPLQMDKIDCAAHTYQVRKKSLKSFECSSSNM